MYYFNLWLRMLIGYKYFVNNRSNEVHKIDSLHKSCHLTVSRTYLTEKKYQALLEAGEINGCALCNKEADQG